MVAAAPVCCMDLTRRHSRRPEVLSSHDENDIVPVVLKKPDHHRTLAVALQAGHCFTDVEGRADPAYCNCVGYAACEALHLLDLGLGETADDTGSVRDVLPGPVAHAVAASASCKIR